MQTPLNKRVIGRHVGQKRKKGAQSTQRLDCKNSACGPLAMQMICHSRLHGVASTVCSASSLATCWVAVRQKLKPNNDFQSKQHSSVSAGYATPRTVLRREGNAIRASVIMRQMREASRKTCVPHLCPPHLWP